MSSYLKWSQNSQLLASYARFLFSVLERVKVSSICIKLRTHICERIILDQKSRGNGDNITAGVQQNKLFKLTLQSNFENSSVTAKLRRTYICLNWIII